MEIDFEGSDVQTTQVDATQDNNNAATQEDRDDLNGTQDVEDVNEQTTPPVEETNEGEPSGTGNTQAKEEGDDTSSTGGLEPGTQIEFDGVQYVVDKDGNIVDGEGKLFKAAGDVQAWLDENNTVDEDGPLSIDNIQSAIGVEVLDEAGNPIEFTNDAKGVSQYINGVLDVKAKEIQEGAINKLFVANPMVKQFIDYVAITGTPRGFGEIPDRSGIVLDKDNKEQQAAVIRMAAVEFGNKSLNENYIKYLESTGSLYDEANAQLKALVEKDKQVMKSIEQRAEEMRRQQDEEVNEYWNSVANAIGNRIIGGYKIPETFVKEVNGQKVTYTPDDFYDYLSKQIEVDEAGNGVTAYQRDLASMSKEEVLSNDLLNAWLMFTKGSYKDLVDMAVKQNEVRKLIIKSRQQRSNKAVKVVKPKQSKVSMDDILLS